MTSTHAIPIAALAAQAEQFAGARRWPEAIRAYEAILRLRPEDPGTLVQLSYVHSLAGHYRQALDDALRAQRTGTTDVAVLKELLPRLRTFNAGPALLQSVDRLLPMSRMPIPLLLTVAAQLSYLNLADRAIAFLDEARRADPDFPPTRLARAQVSIYLGRFGEARADIASALARAPQIAQAYWLQAPLLAHSPDLRRVEAIRVQMERPGRSPADQALLGFALHQELHALGDHAGAWQALERGCEAKRGMLRYDAVDNARLFAELESLDLRTDSGEGQAARLAPGAGGDDATPVFIVGMHRSGTTLLEQLLSNHGDVRGIGELYDFTSAMRYATDHHCRGVLDRTLVGRAGRVDLDEVGRRYLDGVRWRLARERVFTDKLPSNFLNIGFICRALPQARILHMVRDPVETCFSNLRELFSDANPYSYDQVELAEYFLGYRRLMAHWRARYPGRILDVDYARLVADTEGQMREVAAFCGLPFDPRMVSTSSSGTGVVTASAVQVRGPIAAPASPKWAPYAAWLGPMIDRLG